MSKLKELGISKSWACSAATDFKFYSSSYSRSGKDIINTDTIISLNHEREEGESMDDFKMRVMFTVYGRIKALYEAFPHEIEANGITMKLDSSNV